VLELCQPDVVWDDPLTEGAEFGQRAVKEYLQRAWSTFPDMEFTYSEEPYVGDDGSRMALHWRVSATMHGEADPPGFAATGKRVRAEGVDLLHLRDGKVEHYVGLFDAYEMARQLGLAPQRHSTAERVAVGLQRLQVSLSHTLPTVLGQVAKLVGR
jgi:predicted ester cyclase